jgi:hypothetical protein
LKGKPCTQFGWSWRTGLVPPAIATTLHGTGGAGYKTSVPDTLNRAGTGREPRECRHRNSARTRPRTRHGSRPGLSSEFTTSELYPPPPRQRWRWRSPPPPLLAPESRASRPRAPSCARRKVVCRSSIRSASLSRISRPAQARAVPTIGSTLDLKAKGAGDVPALTTSGSGRRAGKRTASATGSSCTVKVMASVGQAATHESHGRQSAASTIALPSTRYKAPVGQASKHNPQPVHLDASIVIMSSHLLRLIDSFIVRSDH